MSDSTKSPFRMYEELTRLLEEIVVASSPRTPLPSTPIDRVAKATSTPPPARPLQRLPDLTPPCYSPFLSRCPNPLLVPERYDPDQNIREWLVELSFFLVDVPPADRVCGNVRKRAGAKPQNL
ncbi:unnamed protein product [Schistocephalus solidus]|uniref:Uncharacterized protein n=1 Tax=Schistocephalus solidus TaxID=70667 RepID=A0A183SR28_SCHSO|nr:unnamed protein product [Schistocephalus solidus]